MATKTTKTTTTYQIVKDWDGNERVTERGNGRTHVSQGRWQWVVLVNGEADQAYDRKREAVARIEQLKADAIRSAAMTKAGEAALASELAFRAKKAAEAAKTYAATDRNGEPVRVTVPENDEAADRLTFAQEQKLVEAAAVTFPATFGLRAFPGDRFRIEVRSSFYSDYAGGVQLVVQRDCGADGFRDFTRDLPAAIRAQMVDFTPTAKEGADANRRAHDPASFERLAQLKAEAAARDLAASLAACTGAIAVTVKDGPVTVTVTQAEAAAPLSADDEAFARYAAAQADADPGPWRPDFDTRDREGDAAEPEFDMDGTRYHAPVTAEDEALARQYDEATYPPAKAAATATKACPRCKGTGTVTIIASWKGGSAAPLACTKCQGSGKVVKASRVRR